MNITLTNCVSVQTRLVCHSPDLSKMRWDMIVRLLPQGSLAYFQSLCVIGWKADVGVMLQRDGMWLRNFNIHISKPKLTRYPVCRFNNLAYHQWYKSALHMWDMFAGPALLIIRCSGPYACRLMTTLGHAGRIGITKVNSLVISTNNYTLNVAILNRLHGFPTTTKKPNRN